MASSYQTLSDVYTDVRYIAGKDSSTLADADLLRMANKYYLLIIRELVDLNEGLYGEISSADLVINQNEYALPIDDTSTTFGGGLVKLYRVETNYDGSSSGWKVADPISPYQISTPTYLDADINSTFDKSDPKYWFFDRSVWLAPVPDANVTNGLFIYWAKRPNEMTTSADIPNLPKDFLSLLTEGILIDIFRRLGRTAEAKQAQANWQMGILNIREKEAAPDTEQPLIMKPARKNYK